MPQILRNRSRCLCLKNSLEVSSPVVCRLVKKIRGLVNSFSQLVTKPPIENRLIPNLRISLPQRRHKQKILEAGYQ